MNLIINAYPKIDSNSLGFSLAKVLARRLRGKTHTINIYDFHQHYFNYRYNFKWIHLLLAAKTIIVPVPMWNFMIPAALKDFFDKTIKRGRLWDIDEKGKFIGFLSGREVYVIMTSGGKYPKGSSHDFVIPYLRAVFAFMGIRQIREFRIGNVGNTSSLVRNKVYFKGKSRQMFKAFGL